MSQPYFPPPGEFGPPPDDAPLPSRWPRVLLVAAVVLLLVGGIVLTVLLLTSEDDEPTAASAPSDASPAEFCSAMRELDIVRGEVPGQAAVDAYADGLARTGTPEDISDEARAGFELLVGTLDELEVSGSPESLAMALGSQLMGSEFLAFVGYVRATCR